MYSLLATMFPFFSLLSAFPLVSQVRRDVWAPPITHPTSTTVWVAGSTYHVTWNASNPPSDLTNPIGVVILRPGVNATEESVLTQGFDLTAGVVSVTIPADTPPGEDYIVILMGDSGDWSPQFTIVAPPF